MISSFKAIFFDAGGTLLHPYPSVGAIYEKVSAKYGCREKGEVLEQRFREAWLKRDGLTSLQGHSSEKKERDWWHSLVQEVFSKSQGMKDFEAFFEELYDLFAKPECWRLYPGTLEVLEAIKKQGKKLGVISNWDSRLLPLCKGLGLDTYFDFILASALFGASKPSPKIFEEALAQSGVEPGQAVHIGDSLKDDIHGAQAVGLEAILIERHPGRELPKNIKAIHDLRELIESC